MHFKTTIHVSKYCLWFGGVNLSAPTPSLPLIEKLGSFTIPLGYRRYIFRFKQGVRFARHDKLFQPFISILPTSRHEHSYLAKKYVRRIAKATIDRFPFRMLDAHQKTTALSRIHPLGSPLFELFNFILLPHIFNWKGGS